MHRLISVNGLTTDHTTRRTVGLHMVVKLKLLTTLDKTLVVPHLVVVFLPPLA